MFIEEEPTGTHAFIQYKNTDICIDFYCECGSQCHYDGYFAYAVKCPYCQKVWEMPCYLEARLNQRDNQNGYVSPLKEEDDPSVIRN